MRFPRIALAMLAVFVMALVLVPAASAGVGRVVVLGDSLASGTNLGPRVPGSYAACGQTTGSYPQLAKVLIQPSSWADASCNGGHTGVMQYSWWGLPDYIIDPAERVEIPPQFDSLNGTEQAVILGTGGNEAYFGEVAFACLGYSPDQNLYNTQGPNAAFYNNCTKTYVNASTGYNRLRDKVANSETAVGGALTQIRQRSPNAKIFLIGTPRIVPPNGGGCMPNPILTPADAPVYAVWEDQLRLAMQRRVAAVSNTYYVDMHTIGGSSHTMCAPAASRWMNGWSTENIQYPGLALHNTPLGAQAMATAIADSMRAAGLDVPAGPTGPTGPSGPVAPDVARTNPVANPTKSTTQVLTYSGTPGNTFQCKLDGGSYAPCPSSPVTLNNLPSGTHTYSVTQTTPGNVVSPVGSVTWVVDATPPLAPTVTRTSPSANPTKLTTQTLTYSGAEAGGTFQCKLDNEAFAPCPSSPVTLPSVPHGNHTYSVTQTDAVGNIGSATTIAWTVDTVAPATPSVTRTNPTQSPTTSTSQTITYGGEAGGTFQCKLDTAASYTPCPSSPLTLTGLPQGARTYSVTQTDAAGNVSPVGSVSWTVDTTAPAAPTVTRTSPTANPTNLISQVITYAGEAGGSFQCKLDSEAFGACTASPITLTGLPEGQHSFSVTQTDAAGNVGSASTVTWTVDTTPPGAPTVTRTNPTANPTSSTSQTIAYSGEAGASFECKLDSGSFAPCTGSPKSLSVLPNGARTYSVRQTDAAGNVGTVAGSVSWTIDSTAPGAPTVTRTNPTTSPTNSPTQELSITGAEAGGTFQCKLDSAAYGACPASPFTVPNLVQGSHTYSVVHTDAAGNTSAPGTATWTFDSVGPSAPALTRTSPSANPTKLTSQVLTYAGAEGGGTFQCKLDSDAYAACPSSPVTLPSLSSGVHTYSVTQIDAAGNPGSAATVTWTIDTTPPGAPTVTRTSPTASPTNSTTQAFSYSGAEAGGSFQCKLDNATFAPCQSSPFMLNGLTGGSRTYSVTQTDAAGNASAPGTVSWTVDLTPPPAPVVSGPSGTTAFRAATIAYSDLESGVTFQCKLDNEPYAACDPSPVSLSDIPNGVHTYSVTATDSVGNVSAAGTVTWTVDPSIFSVSIPSGPSSPTNQRSASLAFSATISSGTTFECKLDSESFGSCASPKAYSNLDDGTHTFAVRALNGAQTSPQATRTWVVDATPPAAPALTRTSPTANPTNLTSQTLSFAASEAGGVLTCRLDGAPFTTCPSSPVTVSNLPAGTHTYSVVQTDAAGNTGSVASVSWVVDPTPPIAPTVIRTSPSGSPTSSSSQAISYSGEAGGTFQCKLDAAEFGPCPASPLTLPNLPDGLHSFSVMQTDAAGNTSAPSSVSWTVDTTAPLAPSVTRTSPTANPTNNTSQTVAFSGEAGGTFRCKLDSGAYSPCTSNPATPSGLPAGSHTYSVTQTDAAGNVSPAGSVTWTVDLVPPNPPTVTRTSPTTSPTAMTSQTITYTGEAGATFKCRLDGAAFAPCQGSPLTIDGLDEGTHTFSVVQTDAAGNDGTPASVTWTVDRTPPAAPSVARTSPTATPTNITTQSITYGAAESGGSFQCKLDGDPYGACPPSPLTLPSLPAGPHTYSVIHTDAAGNASNAGSVSWTIDTTAPLAPSVTRTSPTANPTKLTSQSITYSGEPGGSFQCKLDAAAYGACTSSPLTLTNLPGGARTYSIRQIDAAGNVGPAATVTWDIDLTPPAAPTVSRTSPTANPTKLTAQTITYGSEPGGSFQCKLDDADFGPCAASPITVSGLFDGPHTYSVAQTDAAGNTGSSTTVAWTVDTTAPPAPNLERTSPTAALTNSTSQTVALLGEAGGSFQCKIDNGAYSPCAASPLTLTGLPEGSRTLSVTQTDAAGNVGAPNSVTWTIDTTPPYAPTATRTTPTDNPTSSRSQSISFGGFESGGTFQCKLDAGPFGPCAASPITEANLSDGQHTALFTHTDAAGNVSSPKSITWTVDATGPAAPNVSRTSPTVSPTSSTSQTISFTGEAGGTFECKLDDQALEMCPSSPLTVTGLSLGAHTFTVVQTDVLGNVGSAGTVSWFVGPELPTPTGPTTIAPPPEDPIVPKPVTAKLSAVAPKSVSPARSGGPFSLKPKYGVAGFNVTLSIAAKVRVRLVRVVNGRAAQASTTWTEFTLKSGRTTIRISGRTKKRALAPGNYRVHLTVPGSSIEAFSKPFRIKR